MRATVCSLAVSGLLFATAANATDDGSGEQRSGPGRPIADSGLFAGGYATLSARDVENTPLTASLDSVSLLLWWENDSRFSAFAEVELEDALALTADGTSGAGRELALERLHLDYAWSDALQLRLGKFLTPVGRWNQIHAAPLTWTTSRPLITESTFPTNATGLMLRGNTSWLQRPLEWSVYASPGIELLPEDDIDVFREAIGGRLDYSLTPELKLGLSLVEFEQKQPRGDHRTLVGMDFLWNIRGGELSGEYAVRTLERGDVQADERGAYLQAVVPIHGHLFGVMRYETFDAVGSTSDLHLYLGGVAWRWQPGWVAKLEYRHATENPLGLPEGFLGSIAVLF